MKEIAVRELAYFSDSSGDLSVEFFSNRDENLGKMAHEYHQGQYLENDKAEVYIKYELDILGEKYLLHGFIDGVLKRHGKTIIEEIKSTTSDLDLINVDFHKEHLAQAKIYAYLYMLINNLEYIDVRLTYISIVDYDTKSFDMNLKKDELEDYVFKLIDDYVSFLNLVDESKKNRKKTIEEIEFPFSSKRIGQLELMKAVYQALSENDILYTIAPTGIGKTMATIFPALKTLKDNDKLFYVTAKELGKEAPLKAIRILMDNGLKMKCISITAKRKICNNKMANCNPDECPFAKGYFDRLKDATLDIFSNYDIYDSNTILKVTNKHKICAFEFSLYLSYFCDLVIADYNYVFDPHAHLIRYFDDDTYKPKVLVDEAHNLISRSKEMYSSVISSDDLRVLRSKMNGITPSIRKECNFAIEKVETYRENLKDNAIYVTDVLDLNIDRALRNLIVKVDECLSENKNDKIKDKDVILEVYYKMLDFVRIGEFFGKTHRFIARLDNDNIYIEYFCMDASKLILDTINTSIHGIVFFSATLYPIKYHMDLITHGEGKYLELESPFDPNNLDIIINNKISTKYKNREYTIDDIIEYIEALVESKEGNYIVFFPSYQYLNMVKEKIIDPDYELIIQENKMSDNDKNIIMEKFKNTTNKKVGLFVSGGSFSEGIDLIGDALSGVIIVSVSLPMICDENDILKDYFEEEYQKGFDYAYTYPGFTKVIQAVGRVIRDVNDKGIAILIDERFTYSLYKRLYPPHWKNIKIINNTYDIKKEIKDFYRKNM
ncbi:MAG: hypothetical protein K6E20_01140 [Acholeplasmatales bacterium]|nr:hypothetical protein [Acholeplasmatales bacterium]